MVRGGLNSSGSFWWHPAAQWRACPRSGAFFEGKLLMNIAAGAPEVYANQGPSPHVFSINMMSTTYMYSGIAAMRHMGAKTMVVTVGKLSFDQAMCDNAVKYAESLGFEVMAKESIDDNLIKSLRLMKAMSPDVLVSCGDELEAVEVIVNSRSLGFSPDGMLINDAAKTKTIGNVGAPNANYVMSPIAWAPATERPNDRVFRDLQGSLPGFSKLYRDKYGEEPTHTAAQAAAGVIALLGAVEKAQSVETQKVRTALLELDMESFYKPLSFHPENGTLKTQLVWTQQVQKLTEREEPSKHIRYNTSKIVLVAPTDQVIEGKPVRTAKLEWPMLEWENKEIEVYPCDPGEEWKTTVSHITQAVKGHCMACPIGTFRSKYMVSCVPCDANTFGDEIGMASCVTCPSGADCPRGLRPGRPNASDGYYKLPSGQLTIVQCHPPELCLGNNTCSGAHTGVLCQRCEEGYASFGLGSSSSHCVECAGALHILFTWVLLLLVYTLCITILVRATQAGSAQIRAMPSVILKICVNYLLFASTSFEATEFTNMVRTVVGAKAAYFTPAVAIPGMLWYPFDTVLSFDCIILPSGTRKHQIFVIMGCVIMPMAFMGKFAASIVTRLKRRTAERRGVLMKRMTRRLKRIGRASKQSPPQRDVSTAHSVRELPTVQISEVPMVERTDSLTLPVIRRMPTGMEGGPPTHAESLAAGRSFWSSSSPSPSPRRGLSSPETPYTPHTPHTPQTPITPRTPSQMLRRAMTSETVQDQGRIFIQSTIVMGFVLHPLVVQLLLVSFKCVPYDSLRLAMYLDELCNSDEHAPWVALSALGICVWGLGFPIFLFVLLHRKKHKLLQADTIKKYGFLYTGFELRYYYMEAFFMLRKVVILLLATLPTMYMRMLAMLIASLSFISLHVYTQPFDDRNYKRLDKLELLSLLSLSGTLMSRLVYDIRYLPVSATVVASVSNTSQSMSATAVESFGRLLWNVLVNAAVIGIPVILHISFVGLAAVSLLQSTLVKFLTLKEELFPDTLNRFERLLLALQPRQAALTYNKTRQAIIIDGLSAKELDHLGGALNDTLTRFVQAGANDPREECSIRPGLVYNAVELAFARCHHQRQKRRKELLDAYKKEVQLSWWRPWSFIKAWRTKYAASQVAACRKSVDEFLAHGARASASVKEATVEELYDALMIIWPEIANCTHESAFRNKLFGHQRDKDALDYMLEMGARSFESCAFDFRDDSRCSQTSRSPGVLGDVTETSDDEEEKELNIDNVVGRANQELQASALAARNEALLEEIEELNAARERLRIEKEQLQLKLDGMQASPPLVADQADPAVYDACGSGRLSAATEDAAAAGKEAASPCRSSAAEICRTPRPLQSPHRLPDPGVGAGTGGADTPSVLRSLGPLQEEEQDKPASRHDAGVQKSTAASEHSASGAEADTEVPEAGAPSSTEEQSSEELPVWQKELSMPRQLEVHSRSECAPAPPSMQDIHVPPSPTALPFPLPSLLLQQSMRQPSEDSHRSEAFKNSGNSPPFRKQAGQSPPPGSHTASSRLFMPPLQQVQQPVKLPLEALSPPLSNKSPAAADHWSPAAASFQIGPVSVAEWSGPVEFLRAMRPADPAGLPSRLAEDR
eukprot:TRINITY_DN8780_c0_g1_i1.p1 TRINITY_DN8780_c0_g1~~TRINITY_DN8780_c0_g1_i1.p1  ORF type:complete len:1616 (+),score=323.13 TRINITY_DN8780_c0_g1_i1:266-5113(+)